MVYEIFFLKFDPLWAILGLKRHYIRNLMEQIKRSEFYQISFSCVMLNQFGYSISYHNMNTKKKKKFSNCFFLYIIITLNGPVVCSIYVLFPYTTSYMRRSSIPLGMLNLFWLMIFCVFISMSSLKSFWSIIKSRKTIYFLQW